MSDDTTTTTSTVDESSTTTTTEDQTTSTTTLAAPELAGDRPEQATSNPAVTTTTLSDSQVKENREAGHEAAAVASPQAEPQGELRVDGKARAHILGEEHENGRADQATLAAQGHQDAFENARNQDQPHY